MPKISKSVREYIYNRDGNQCLRCNATEDLTIDHVIPLVLKGPNSIGNMQTLCKTCNNDKGENIVDYRWIEHLPASWYDLNTPFNKAGWDYPDYAVVKPGERIKKTQFGESLPELPRATRKSRKKKNFVPRININAGINDDNSVFYNNRRCYVYGVLKQGVGYMSEAGQAVFYDKETERLLLNITGTIIAYHFESLKKYVCKNDRKQPAGNKTQGPS